MLQFVETWEGTTLQRRRWQKGEQLKKNETGTYAETGEQPKRNSRGDERPGPGEEARHLQPALRVLVAQIIDAYVAWTFMREAYRSCGLRWPCAEETRSSILLTSVFRTDERTTVSREEKEFVLL